MINEESPEQPEYTTLTATTTASSTFETISKEFIDGLHSALTTGEATTTRRNKRKTSLKDFRQTTLKKLSSAAASNGSEDEESGGATFCMIETCNIAYDSAKDRAMLKDKRYRWIGCDYVQKNGKKCDFWAHALCAQFKLPARGKLPTFYCEVHKLT